MSNNKELLESAWQGITDRDVQIRELSARIEQLEAENEKLERALKFALNDRVIAEKNVSQLEAGIREKEKENDELKNDCKTWEFGCNKMEVVLIKVRQCFGSLPESVFKEVEELTDSFSSLLSTSDKNKYVIIEKDLLDWVAINYGKPIVSKAGEVMWNLDDVNALYTSEEVIEHYKSKT